MGHVGLLAESASPFVTENVIGNLLRIFGDDFAHAILVEKFAANVVDVALAEGNVADCHLFWLEEFTIQSTTFTVMAISL